MELIVSKKKIKVGKKLKCVMVSLCCCLITSGVAVAVGKNTDIIANTVTMASEIIKTVKN